VRAKPYDIVLMDMQMPVMDGLTATLEIRKEKDFDTLPIVAMTANAMHGDRDRCLQAGMNDHVAKPIEPDDLWKALLKWIQPRHTDAAIPPPKPTAALELPGNIEGLDMVNGLRRVLGKKKLYLSMLGKFVAGQKTVTADILKALEDGSWDSAERLAHTLKGVCGNIGASNLQQLAAKLESAIKERQTREKIQTQLDELEAPLEKLIVELELQLPQPQGKTLSPLEREKLSVVCARLNQLLIDDDAESLDVLEANAALLDAAFPRHFTQIDAAIRSCNFKAALSALSVATGVSS
jgi:CheY-like chemotaxis protein